MMRYFKDIHEGILSGQEETLNTGDVIAKKMKEVESIKKNLFILDILWKNSSGGSNKQDFFGRDIRIGDVVLANIGDNTTDDWSFGIVVEEPDKYGDNCRIIVSNTRIPGNNENDPYTDCIDYYVPSKNIFVLARNKKSKQILQIIENTIN